MGWPGYEAALKRDPEGVKAVLRVLNRIPHTEGRANMSPTLMHEAAWIIEKESRWLPNIQNYINGKPFATGLIQFTPDTAAQLGTSPNELKAMSMTEQSKYVEKYFEMVLGKVGPAAKPGDLYMSTFYPAAMHAPPDYIIGDQYGAQKISRLIWEQNPGLRCTPDGPITAGCVRNYGIPKTEPPSGFPDISEPGPSVSGGATAGAGGLLFVLFLAWAARKYMP